MEHSYDTPERSAEPHDTTSQSSRAGWSARITRVVARQVRYWREQRDLSALQLSERTKELGYQVPRSVIANLENDRRDTVSVAELLIFAAALDVPPTMLLTAVGLEPEVEILPNLAFSTWRSRGWILGARYPNYRSFSLANWAEARRAIVLYDVHRMLVAEYFQIQKRLRRSTEQDSHDLKSIEVGSGDTRQDVVSHMAQELAVSLHRITRHRKLIRDEDYLLPDLPPGLAVLLSEADLLGSRGDQISEDDRASHVKRLAFAIVNELSPPPGH